MTQVALPTVHEQAVMNARAAEKVAELAERHLAMEFTQDIEKVLATLATDAPLAWTLPELGSDGTHGHVGNRPPGGLKFLCATTLDEIRQQYVNVRKIVEVWEWETILEIRQNWYTVNHGVVAMKDLDTGDLNRMETVTMFPAGEDGILGELQIGDVGILRENRWPEVPSSPGEIPLPVKRLEALAAHNRYVDDLRVGNVEGIVAAHRNDSAIAIRSYLADESMLLNATGASEIADYFEKLFERFLVHDIRLVNRVVESWYVFAELHWMVEERSGARRKLEFCTGEISPLDPDAKFWVRTGAGTDPVKLAG